MKISIITVALNSEETIGGTIQSVLNQNYPNIEFIIIDGGSTDKTINIVKTYQNVVEKFISEPDKGIYDAMNKGIKMATGDIIGILNSDDTYADYDIISKVANIFKNENVDSLYGDLCYVAKHNSTVITRYWKSGVFKIKKMRNGWMAPHPTFFVRREIYEKYGIFNADFKLAGDYEMIVRLLYKHQISTYYLPQVMVIMRSGGASNGSLKNRLLANSEDRKAWRVNQLALPIFTTFFKPTRKISQFVRYPQNVNFFPALPNPIPV